MPIARQEKEAGEEALRMALHQSREVAQWTSLAGTRQELRIGRGREAARPPTLPVDGSRTHIPPPTTTTTTGSPDLIPDSEPSSSASASREEDGSSEEDLASVPSTVQIGSPGSADGREDFSKRLVRFLGGTWRKPNGS